MNPKVVSCLPVSTEAQFWRICTNFDGSVQLCVKSLPNLYTVQKWTSSCDQGPPEQSLAWILFWSAPTLPTTAPIEATSLQSSFLSLLNSPHPDTGLLECAPCRPAITLGPNHQLPAQVVSYLVWPILRPPPTPNQFSQTKILSFSQLFHRSGITWFLTFSSWNSESTAFRNIFN